MAHPKIFFEEGSIICGAKVIRECEPLFYKLHGQKTPLRQYALQCSCGAVFKRTVGKLQRDLKYNVNVRCLACLKPRPKPLELPLPTVVKEPNSKPLVTILRKLSPPRQRNPNSKSRDTYVHEIHARLVKVYPTLTLTQVRNFLTIELQVIIDQLRRSGETRIPNVAKLTIVNKPGRQARLIRNPATGEAMCIEATPPHKKVRVKPVTYLLSNVGALINKRSRVVAQKHRDLDIKRKALAKLTSNERKALGLSE